jgi:zona occludens toxin (predicted ATPase)
MADEQRNEQRHRTLKPGLIVFNNGFSTIECLVRNLSESGAQLKVESLIGIPDEFQLKLKDAAAAAPARIAWKRGQTIGIKFIDEPAK